MACGKKGKNANHQTNQHGGTGKQKKAVYVPILAEVSPDCPDYCLNKYPEVGASSGYYGDVVTHYSVDGKDYILSKRKAYGSEGQLISQHYRLFQLGRNREDFLSRQIALENINSTDVESAEDAKRVVENYLQNRGLLTYNLQKRYEGSRFAKIFDGHLDTSDIDATIRDWMKQIETENNGWLPRNFTVEFEFENPVRIPTTRIRSWGNAPKAVTRKALRMFVSRRGILAYYTSSARGLAVSELPRDRIIGMRVVEKALAEQPLEVRAAKAAKKFHPQFWPDLKKQLLEAPSTYEGDKRFKTVSLRAAFGDVGDYVVEQIKKAVEEGREFRFGIAGVKRDKSVYVKPLEDGTVRAWYSSEYAGYGNGSYYLLISPETALYCEDD